MYMVLFFITTLIISLLGIGVLVGAKRFELATGTVFGGNARPRIGNFFHALLMWFERVLPHVLSAQTRRALHVARLHTQRWLASTLLATERKLEGWLHELRHLAEGERPQGEASAFLREVAEHKKNLLLEQRALDESRKVD